MTRIHRQILYGILAAYVILAVIYSVITPIFEASDELWHYPTVKYLADNGLQLPPQDPANPGPWRQEGSQPPLYYIISAILTAGIDTSDLETVRQQNPHADIGIVRPDGNVNMMIHNTQAEGFPWHGTALAVHIIRFMSVLMGLGTVLATYLLTRAIFPELPAVALGATALNAFLPMFLFISGSVNNDNLSNLLGNLLTLLLVWQLKAAFSPVDSKTKLSFGWQQYLLIGIVTGGGLLSKLNFGFLIPLVAITLLVVSWRRRDWRPLILGGLISGIATILIAGWWYLRNLQLYNDPTGLDMFLQMVGRRAIPANAAQLWSERTSFTEAYWGFFGGVNVPLPDITYLVFNVIGGIGLISAILFIAYTLLFRKWSLEQWLPTTITIIWPLVTFISYLRWTAETQASQGRLIFGALSAISLWMAIGLVWWLPKRLHALILGAATSYFGIVALLTPFLIIAPTYALPENIMPGQATIVFHEANGSGEIGLSNAQILTVEVQPEAYVQVDMDWQIIKPMSQNWSLFLHLVTQDGVIVSQRDVYPGQGKLATGSLSTEQSWHNPVVIWVPPTAYAPNTLDVVLGWYNLQTGERLKLDGGAEITKIGEINLLPRNNEFNTPNPIHVNFDHQIELVGYSLTDLSPKPGDQIELTLYWRGLKKMEQDYVVFAHILNPPTQTIYAGSDAMPAQWTAPTASWKQGIVVEDKHSLTIRPDAPPGMYSLEIGLYLQAADGSFPRLRVVTSDGGMADNFIYLTNVRIVTMDAN